MGVDWTLLVTAVRNLDVETVEEYAAEEISKPLSHYKIVQRALEEFCFSQVTVEERAKFVLNAVPVLRRDLRYLFLELLEPNCAACDSPAVRELASEVFSHYLVVESDSARVATKIAAAMNLSIQEAGGLQQLLEFVNRLLSGASESKAPAAAKMLSPAVSLMQLYPEITAELDGAGVLSMLVDYGQENLAATLAASMDIETQTYLINHCISSSKLKAAVKMVPELQLDEEFPDIQVQYRRHTVNRLVAKQLWSAAAGFVGDDPGLQKQLVVAMAAGGEMSMAMEFASNYGMGADEVDISEAAIALEIEARARKYFSMPMDVTFVDDPSQLEQVIAFLRDASVVGLDVEWRPGMAGGAKSPAALLQLAADSADPSAACKVFLIDLLTLHTCPQLDTALSPLFQGTPKVIPIVGLELTGDLRKLASSYPSIEAFQTVAGMVDLKQVYSIYATTLYGDVQRKRKRQVGLSFLSGELLGKPLDKSMQVSDWSVRPLSERQSEYAALDAAVQLRLIQAMQVPAGPLTPEAVSQLVVPWHAGWKSVARRGRAPERKGAVDGTLAPILPDKTHFRSNNADSSQVGHGDDDDSDEDDSDNDAGASGVPTESADSSSHSARDTNECVSRTGGALNFIAFVVSAVPSVLQYMRLLRGETAALLGSRLHAVRGTVQAVESTPVAIPIQMGLRARGQRCFQVQCSGVSKCDGRYMGRGQGTRKAVWNVPTSQRSVAVRVRRPCASVSTPMLRVS